MHPRSCRSRSVITERDKSMALHVTFLRTLNFRPSVAGRFSFAGGFFCDSRYGGFETLDIVGGFFSTDCWPSLRSRAKSTLMCSRNSLFDIVAGFGVSSGVGGFFFAGWSGLR
jgi:hypothetical protein